MGRSRSHRENMIFLLLRIFRGFFEIDLPEDGAHHPENSQGDAQPSRYAAQKKPERKPEKIGVVFGRSRTQAVSPSEPPEKKYPVEPQGCQGFPAALSVFFPIRHGYHILFPKIGYDRTGKEVPRKKVLKISACPYVKKEL